MKKVLVFLLSICLASSGFATNSWNRPFGKSAFSDPYVDNFNVSVNGDKGYPNYYVLVQADFDQSVGVPYYVIIQCYGVWDGAGPSYKQFTLLYGSTQWHKTLTYYMKASEECYPETEELVDYGPQ